MMIIEAYQHIYGNVEEDQSPRGVRGFQTLYYSPELTKEEIRQIEKRSVYYSEDENSQPLKIYYYMLNEGKDAKFVIGKVTPQEGLDRFGRRGRVFAHNLVFSRAEFNKIKFNPFLVINQNPFLINTEEAILQWSKNETIPLLQLQVDVEKDVSISGWTDNYRLFVWHMLKAEQMVKQQTFFMFDGPVPQLLDLLAVAFALCPPYARSFCSFDTNYSGMDEIRLPVWLAGIKTRPSAKFTQLSASGAFFDTIPALVPVEPQNGFEQWWWSCVKDGTLAEYQADVERAYILSWCLANAAKPGYIEKINEYVRQSGRINRFDQVNFQAIREAAVKVISSKYGSKYADFLVQEYGKDDISSLWDIITSNEDVNKIENILYAMVAGKWEKTDKELMRIISKAAEQNSSLIKLNTLQKFWNRNDGLDFEEDWLKWLAELSDEYYAELVSLKIADIFDWFIFDKFDSASKAAIWVRLCRNSNKILNDPLSSGGVFQITKLFIRKNYRDALIALRPRFNFSFIEKMYLKSLLNQAIDLDPDILDKPSAPMTRRK